MLATMERRVTKKDNWALEALKVSFAILSPGDEFFLGKQLLMKFDAVQALSCRNCLVRIGLETRVLPY